MPPLSPADCHFSVTMPQLLDVFVYYGNGVCAFVYPSNSSASNWTIILS